MSDTAAAPEESTIITCVNGHPLWASVEIPEATFYYEQAEGVTGRLYLDPKFRNEKPEHQVFVGCDHACDIARDDEKDMRRMLERSE